MYMSAWLGLEMGPASGRKCYLAMFRGSSGGEDLKAMQPESMCLGIVYRRAYI